MSIKIAKEGDEVQVLPLCQSTAIVLRTGVMYEFKLDEQCPTCQEMYQKVLDAYGPDMTG